MKAVKHRRAAPKLDQRSYDKGWDQGYRRGSVRAEALLARCHALEEVVREEVLHETNEDSRPTVGAWVCALCDGCERDGHAESCLLWQRSPSAKVGR